MSKFWKQTWFINLTLKCSQSWLKVKSIFIRHKQGAGLLTEAYYWWWDQSGRRWSEPLKRQKNMMYTGNQGRALTSCSPVEHVRPLKCRLVGLFVSLTMLEGNRAQQEVVWLHSPGGHCVWTLGITTMPWWVFCNINWANICVRKFQKLRLFGKIIISAFIAKRFCPFSLTFFWLWCFSGI